MTNLKGLVQSYIGNHSEEFASWAFGDDYKITNGYINFLNLWNSRHKELYELKGNGTVHEDIPKMCDIWMEQTGTLLYKDVEPDEIPCEMNDDGT